MNSLYDNFSGLYPVSKTLRFELIPQGETLSHFVSSGLLEEDEHRAKSYSAVKKYIDEYHKAFIEKALTGARLSGLEDYYTLYLNSNKSDKEKTAMERLESDFRKQISKLFKDDDLYKSLFSKDLINRDLIKFLGNDEAKIQDVKEFEKFTTYFVGFNMNRENMYSDEAKSTAIAYRLVNDNLPRYLNNIHIYVNMKNTLSNEQVSATEDEISSLKGNLVISECFTAEGFNNVLTQDGIDRYNAMIGVFNKYINLHDQVSAKKDRIGKMTTLNKQILSDRVRLSFIPEQFENDQEVFDSLLQASDNFSSIIDRLRNLLDSIGSYDCNRIYIKNGKDLTSLSQKVYKHWDTIASALTQEYDRENLTKKPTAVYEKKRETYLTKTISSYSIGKLDTLVGDTENNIVSYYATRGEIFDQADEAMKAMKNAFTNYPSSKKLKNDSECKEIIKTYLDTSLSILHLVNPLLGDGEEPDRDNSFYSELLNCYDCLSDIIPLYNKVRNYVTQKPYSTEKIKLNFGNPQLLGGWDANKERDYMSVMLEKDSLYYLCIMDKNNRKSFEEIPSCECNEDVYHKMRYKLLPGPNKMLPKVIFSKKNKDYYQPSDKLVKNYQAGKHKKGANFDLVFCHELIDFFKECIAKHPEWSEFGFSFSDTNDYKDISGFYREVEQQGYQLSFVDVPVQYVNNLVSEGKAYLFQIYNKDFSPYSKGTPNLHTLYWKMLFDERNLRNVVYKLNGEAEIFYRKASIPKGDQIVHPANLPIANKNPENAKKESLFAYDLIKNRRYTVDKFQLHVPITMNFGQAGRPNINEEVRYAIKKQSKPPYIIGVDRGERHLLYIVVIDPDGNIVEQKSLNEIISGHTKTNYQKLLDQREKDRLAARKDWQSIEGIKELKEGYLSQVIHEITTLMVKYNAIVVLEDLNLGFMRSRQKVEKQVYQNFEKKLIEKLNYLADKTADAESPGGLFHAYQLTNKFESFAKLGKQSGVLFYIPAWNTSKMDPTTGFVNLFRIKYESVEKSIDFWQKFDSISFNSKDNYFEFSFDYRNFTTKAEDSKTDWTVCSYGQRIRTFRNPNKNNEWDHETINLTAALQNLFDRYAIEYKNGNLIEAICRITDKAFHEEFLQLFKLILQMRNSISGTETDYLISPVKNASGGFYCSDDASDALPKNADANGAYNIARKGQWVVEQIRNSDSSDLRKLKFDISNKEWLRYAQEHC